MVTPLCRVLEFSEEGWLLIVQDCSTGTADLLPPCHHILMRAFMLNNTHVWYLTLFKVFSLIWSHWIILEPWEASRHAHIWKHLRLELQPESDTTEQLDFHFSLSCIAEGNGNSLQCSCLENPRDGEPGGLPSIGSHRVEHDWSDLAAAAAAAELQPSVRGSIRELSISNVSHYLYSSTWPPTCQLSAKIMCRQRWESDCQIK